MNSCMSVLTKIVGNYKRGRFKEESRNIVMADSFVHVKGTDEFHDCIDSRRLKKKR